MEDDRDPEQDHENELDMCDIPAELKGLRACKRCCLIKTFVQFVEQGCENCPFLHMEEHSERVHECTSSYFTGMITLIEPKGSWVAKWQRISKGKPGIYAVEVSYKYIYKLAGVRIMLGWDSPVALFTLFPCATLSLMPLSLTESNLDVEMEMIV
ncbi:unnamed protein product [Chrysoparadoxa australica]